MTQEALPPLPAPLEMAFPPAPMLMSAAPPLVIPTLPKVTMSELFYTSKVQGEQVRPIRRECSMWHSHSQKL